MKSNPQFEKWWKENGKRLSESTCQNKKIAREAWLACEAETKNQLLSLDAAIEKCKSWALTDEELEELLK